MSRRDVHNYIDDLAAGRRPRQFTPDDFEAAQISTAISLAAARKGADEPRPEFIAGLKASLAQEGSASQPESELREVERTSVSTRRQVIVGTAAAATAAVAAVSVDRLFVGVPVERDEVADGAGQMVPNDGSWEAVTDSSALAEGAVHAFDLGSVSGFVRRTGGRVEAVSGVCTHQGCKLWFDQSSDRLRCPCHLTSFSPAGQVMTHALPIAPKPLPHFEVRERAGLIEVLAPPSQPA
ncbi:Rieske (2Fe-2S) protein [Mycobacterium sp. NBC_00419]|uniref:QcrA and Rieske domain-containing protein n=1 Tax=Mycobacterium sp. NBC_00419 TaxID=2975989 RepID=UPI002E233679